MNAPPKGIVVSEKEAKLEAVADDRDDDYIEGFDEMCSVTQLDAWQEHCARNKTDEAIKSTPGNAATVLTWHRDWKGVLSYDVRTQKVVFVKAPPFAPDYAGAGDDLKFPRSASDADFTRCEMWGQRDEIVSATIRARDWADGLVVAARESPRDLFKDWLDGLRWDGVPRCDMWLQNFANVPDGPYARAVGARMLIAVVARTFKPGCKVDSILTLQGKQGGGKSSLLRALVGSEWFSDADIDITHKDGAINIQGPAILELSELSALSRQQVEKIKAFVTRQTDKFRPPYGRVTEDFPRRCVFVATTNDDSYLRDVTGNRRFWPVTVGDELDVAGVVEARDQLFAEAVTRFKAGELWYLDTPELRALAEEEQSDRRQVDAWEEVLQDKLQGKTFVTLAEALELLGVEVANQDQARQTRGRGCLRALGWTNSRRVKDGVQRRGYDAPFVNPF